MVTGYLWTVVVDPNDMKFGIAYQGAIIYEQGKFSNY